MRLINTTSFVLREFLGDPTSPRFPRYAILSHAWGEEEVTFQDIQNLDTAKKKAGFSKIAKCCETALDEGLNWAWVDTCCIDKSNNSELTEAINSMFKWYEVATICYAYLGDVGDVGVAKHCDWRDSRWFTRGWTLQELVAPFEVIIYDCVWKQLGSKRRLTKELEKKTGIPEDVLLYPAVRRKHSVSARMSWARGRQTTRMEDRAYSLLGLFDIVNMPLVYGEGDKSFSRLHEEIMNTRQDDTIFMGGLASLDDELNERSMETPETTMYGQGFLIKPENVPARLLAMVSPLSETPEKSLDPTQLTKQIFTSGGLSGEWERKDPRLRGNILSMHMRIIQVIFSSYGSARMPITMKRQQHIELNPESKRVLENFDLHGVKAVGGSLCLAMFRCGTTDGRLLARYFLCFLANNELWAYPTAIYRYVTPTEVHHWPYMQCHIFVGRDSGRPFPLLESLRDAAGWGLETQLGGDFDNGWSWIANTTHNTEDLITGQSAGVARRNTHCYQLCCRPTGQILGLTISIWANKNVSQELGISDVDIEIQLTPTDPGSRAQSVKINHKDREGLVTELCHRIPVSRGSAELVVSVYYGVDEGRHYYSPMIRFRAFETDDKEQACIGPKTS